MAGLESARIVGATCSPFNGVMVGCVYADGAALGDALVTLTNHDTELRQTVRTDESGDYAILMLKEGVYSLRIEKDGYSGFASSRVEIKRGEICNYADVFLVSDPGITFTKAEALILQKLLKGYIVGPDGQKVLDKLNSIKEN